MFKSLVSVIVPVYNVEAYLSRCLNSIRNQTYTNIEILLVDDGSTDGSGAICDNYAQIDSRFRVFHLQNGGVSIARNYALDRMKGDYCTFIDSDDYVSPYYVEHELRSIAGDKNSVVLLSDFICLHFSNAENAKQVFSQKQGLTSKIDFDEFDFMNKRYPLTVIGGLFGSNLVKKIRFIEKLNRGEDTLFMTQVLCEARYVYIIREDMYAYIQYPCSLSHGKYNYEKFTELIAWKEICELICDKGSKAYISSRAAFAYRCILRIDDMVVDYEENRKFISYAKRYAKKYAIYVLKYPMSLSRKIKLTTKCFLPELQVYLCKRRRRIR